MIIVWLARRLKFYIQKVHIRYALIAIKSFLVGWFLFGWLLLLVVVVVFFFWGGGVFVVFVSKLQVTPDCRSPPALCFFSFLFYSLTCSQESQSCVFLSSGMRVKINNIVIISNCRLQFNHNCHTKLGKIICRHAASQNKLKKLI